MMKSMDNKVIAFFSENSYLIYVFDDLPEPLSNLDPYPCIFYLKNWQVKYKDMYPFLTLVPEIWVT